MTEVNTAYKLLKVLVLEWRQPTLDGSRLQAFKLTTMTISDYTVLIIFNEHRGRVSTWHVVK